MKLLQVPTAILDDRIKEEIEENPALEQVEDGFEEEYDAEDDFADKQDEETEMDGSEEDYDNIDISEYVQDGDDEIADYKLRDDNFPDKDDQKVTPHRVETSFMDSMLQQVGMLKLTEKQRKIAQHLIGSLDDDGYIRRDLSAIIDDLAFRQNIQTNMEELSDMILQIQQLDPPGVGARNLQECLLLQLERKNPNDKIHLAFNNLNNKKVSLEDEKYKNKVVIIQIMGSWCPNCMDESAYLADVYKKYKPSGLEIIALAYERTPDIERAKNNLKRLIKRFDIGYDILLTGLTGGKQASESLPFLNGIMSFPTTIFLDKNHQVKSIYTGFSGPATGEAYRAYTTKTEKLLKELLGQ